MICRTGGSARESFRSSACRWLAGKRSACPTKQIFQRPNDKLFSLIHRQRERLQNKQIAIAIDNNSGESVALAPDDATEPRIDSAPLPVLDRLRDPALKKIEIQLLSSARKSAGHDLRFGVVDRAPKKTVASILERDHVAVGGISKYLQDLTAEHPIVSVENSRARFNDKATHRHSLRGRVSGGASRKSLRPGSGDPGRQNTVCDEEPGSPIPATKHSVASNTLEDALRRIQDSPRRALL